MADKSKIEWTDATWSPVVGCTKVSEGCQNCYAERMAWRLACMGNHNYRKVIMRKGDYDHQANQSKNMKPSWKGNIHCIESALEIPLHWRNPRRIFVCSMGDLFHPAVPFSYIDKVVDVAEKCPQHTLQFLTKRASIIYDYSKYRDFKWPENIIGMVTAENQARADWCIPYLLRCGFKTTGVSVEPMLGKIRLDYLKHKYERFNCLTGESCNINDLQGVQFDSQKLNQVIIGCESLAGGKVGRFCEDEEKWWDAARDIIEQCKAAGVLVFMKQGPINGKVSHNPEEWPEWARLRQMPKEK